jgi:hypothetical protein
MIEIMFSNHPANQCDLDITGHSGLAKRGEDIICAAASVLAQTFVGGCETELNAEATGFMDSGNCKIRVRVQNNQIEKLQAVYKVFYYGFRKLTQAYPKHIKMN